MYLTHEEYKSFGGSLPLKGFQKYERKARAIVDYYTFRQIKGKISDEVKNCIFELIEFENSLAKARENGSSTISSETVGNHSVSYANAVEALGVQSNGKSKEQLEYEIVATNLMNTGLMYRGVETCL